MNLLVRSLLLQLQIAWEQLTRGFVMARYLATLVSLVLAVVVPFSALALGLGEMDLRSGLNQMAMFVFI